MRKRLKEAPTDPNTVSLSVLTNRLTTPETKLLTDIKAIPGFYAIILIHLYYKTKLGLRQISRLVKRPDSNTAGSLRRLQYLGLVIREPDNYYYITPKGKNEVEALRALFLK